MSNNPTTLKATPAILEGYLQDSQGRLVPVANVRPHELQRDMLVRDLVGRVTEAQAGLALLKRDLLGDINAHLQLVAEKYGVEISGKSGNVTLTSYDGLLKLERDVAERVEVGEQIQAAEEEIRKIIDEIEEPAAKAIVDRVFRRNRKTGELSVSRLIDLVSIEIDDERWTRAVAAIRDAIQVAGSVVYFRAYQREESTQQWRQIALDFSSIQPAPEESAQ